MGTRTLAINSSALRLLSAKSYVIWDLFSNQPHVRHWGHGGTQTTSVSPQRGGGGEREREKRSVQEPMPLKSMGEQLPDGLE